MKIDRNELDRHITGNYGEDQFKDDELEEALCFECAESIADCECPDGFYLGDEDD